MNATPSFRVNPIGLVAAGLLIALAAEREPPWWRLDAGGLAVFNLSPFKATLLIAGGDVMPPIVEWLTLGAWLAVLVGAALMVAGSLSSKPWSKSLVSFGLSKIAWGVGALIALGALIFLATGPSTALLRQFGHGVEVLELRTPLLVGEGLLKLRVAQQVGEVTVTIPIIASLTDRFYLAVASLAACLAARMYQGRLARPARAP
jgi:hypothetical protein